MAHLTQFEVVLVIISAISLFYGIFNFIRQMY